jgi:hypothetical protein
MKSGFAIHIYTANESMNDSCLANADGDLLIVPQQGEQQLEGQQGSGDKHGAWGNDKKGGQYQFQGWRCRRPAYCVPACCCVAGRLRVAMSNTSLAPPDGPTDHCCLICCYLLPGGLRLTTEFGLLEVAPGEVAVVQRGIRFSVDLLDGPARG